MQENLNIDGKELAVSARKLSGNKIFIKAGQKEIEAEILYAGENELILLVDGKKYRCFISAYRDKVFITLDGINYQLHRNESDDYYGSVDAKGGEEEIKSPIPGKVVKVCVEKGAKLKACDLLIIVEAMKMENNIYAPFDLYVENIFVQEGENVDTEKTLIKTKPITAGQDYEK
ncbi:biotin/lipoyl-containing protein [Melioribacter sp. Ez-97]|uniref:biotin/lipoyl-containing protein n=1 Tax=Melioribacter sp. Ez-97 TaxID=3423434 RepID=UPI003EDAAC0E